MSVYWIITQTIVGLLDQNIYAIYFSPHHPDIKLIPWPKLGGTASEFH